MARIGCACTRRTRGSAGSARALRTWHWASTASRTASSSLAARCTDSSATACSMRANAIARARARAASSSCWLPGARGAAAAGMPATAQAVSSSATSTPASSATLMAARRAAKARSRGLRSLGVRAPVAAVVPILPCPPATATGAGLGSPCRPAPTDLRFAPSWPRAAKALPAAANQPRTVSTAVMVPSCGSLAGRLGASAPPLAASSALCGSPQTAVEPRMARTVPPAMSATAAMFWKAVAAILAGECTSAVACSAPSARATAAAAPATCPGTVCAAPPAEVVPGTGCRSLAPSSAGAACRFCRPALSVPAPASKAFAAFPGAVDMASTALVAIATAPSLASTRPCHHMPGPCHHWPVRRASAAVRPWRRPRRAPRRAAPRSTAVIAAAKQGFARPSLPKMGWSAMAVTSRGAGSAINGHIPTGPEASAWLRRPASLLPAEDSGTAKCSS
mmetsp:Transcript_15631/g.49428  ORF Transcript_15631/g.49428 Transcript_15631/m.49428 type:complete len:451 (-) Transcript_15631:182-1534(-)